MKTDPEELCAHRQCVYGSAQESDGSLTGVRFVAGRVSVDWRVETRRLDQDSRLANYDPTYHGVDMDARFKAADIRLQSANSLGAALTTIGETLDGLKDSHTFFLPPSRNTRRDYGYIQEMIGDRCFITAVRPDRDASEKLAAGR